MRKLLILSALLTSSMLAGCGSVDKLPFLHRIDVQQGNVVTQEALNQLEPGMSKRQVRFIMGTPLVHDTFNPDRWDYVYRMEPGGGETTSYKVTLHFQDDGLAEIVGDKRPQPGATATPETARQSTTVVVPPKRRKPRGILSQLWDWITFRGDDELE